MKRFLLSLLLIVGVHTSYGQTWNEWFRQKKTQIQYLVKQIAALKVYTDYLEKGYNIAKDGTNLINDIKHGDFNLHNNYFTSLKSVSSSVRNYSKVSAIVSDQTSILKNFRKLLNYCDGSDQLSSSEKEYIHSVYSNLNAESEKDLDELFLVITSGEVEMKEDERIKKIDRIYLSVKDKVSFSKSFSSQVLILIHQRFNDKIDIDRSKKIFGLQ